jgi:hypothetical protein
MVDTRARVLERSVPAGSLGGVEALHPAGKAGDGARPLDDRSRDLLDFEREWWMHSGPKERMIRERFGFSAARYHQLLNRIVDGDAALTYDPMLVRRLRRLREERRRKRFARRLGLER